MSSSAELPTPSEHASPDTVTEPATPAATPDRPRRPGRYLPGMGWAANEAIDHHRALHNRGELAALLSILEVAEPHIILEIGTWAGGSAWAFSRIPTVNHIVTVDERPQPEAAEMLASLPCRATQILGDSRAAPTVAAVERALENFRPDVVFIDGGHEYHTARFDYVTYGSMVAAGGLVVLHDTQGYPGNDTVQVPQLWAELRNAHRATELVDLVGGPGGTGVLWF